MDVRQLPAVTRYFKAIRARSVPVELRLQSRFPAGVLNVVHGNKEVVDGILDHQTLKAVSFVGYSDNANYVYERGARAGKRVQAMGGAKNHGIVMPDADLDQVVTDLVGAAYGSAGERCMALPVVVPVGDETAEKLKAKLIPAIKDIMVSHSEDPNAHYGPVVTAAHKERVEGYIDLCIEEGAELVYDGRTSQIPDDSQVTSSFNAFDHDQRYALIPRGDFCPVLQMVRAKDFNGG